MSQPLLFLKLLILLRLDVAITRYSYIYHYRLLSLLVHLCAVDCHHQIAFLYLKVSQDLIHSHPPS